MTNASMNGQAVCLYEYPSDLLSISSIQWLSPRILVPFFYFLFLFSNYNLTKMHCNWVTDVKGLTFWSIHWNTTLFFSSIPFDSSIDWFVPNFIDWYWKPQQRLSKKENKDVIQKVYIFVILFSNLLKCNKKFRKLYTKKYWSIERRVTPSSVYSSIIIVFLILLKVEFIPLWLWF